MLVSLFVHEYQIVEDFLKKENINVPVDRVTKILEDIYSSNLEEDLKEVAQHLREVGDV